MSLFNSIVAGTSQLRQFVSLSGQTLTFDLLAVSAGTSLPFSATLPTGTASLVMPTGTLINEVRIQVQNVTVTGGLHPTMLFSGIVSSGSTTTSATTVTEAGVVMPTTLGTGAPGSPLVPNLFGNLSGDAASVSLAFNETFPFPGITSVSATTTGTTTGATSTGATGTTSTATGFSGTSGTNGAVPVSMLSITVAGAFDLASPTGFATVSVTSGTTSTTGATTTTTGAGPVIQLAPFNFQTTTRSITLDAGSSSSPNGGLTFSWTSVGQLTATISGANTPTPTITFPTPGTFQIQLTVTDATGASSTMVIPITVLM